MNETILSIIGAILVAIISYVLGSQTERRKQIILIKSNELREIEEWLSRAEKLVSIFSDTLVAVRQNLPTPILYNHDDRKKVHQYLTEKSNAILSIIGSKDNNNRKTKDLTNNLSNVICDLDILIKYQLLPIENSIIELSNNHQITEADFFQGLKVKIDADELLKKAYKHIRQIKIRLM